jgi:hypothetical protein
MGKTVSKTLDYLMPAALDKEGDEFYRAFIGDADTDSGAMTNEVKDVTGFINYYTRTQKVDDAATSLLEFIVYIFSGLTRRYSEPDDYLRLRYKALVERKQTNLWNGKSSIKSVFSYFFNEKNIYLIERYPVDNMVINGDFDDMESWVYNTVDTEFRLIYSRSFESSAAMYINPSKVDSIGYMEQQMPSVPVGIYEFVFFFSSPKKGIGDVQFSIRDGEGRYWNGSDWIGGEYLFYEMADMDTAGTYKSIQQTVNVPVETNITIRFKNKNGNGVLIDSVRFGKTNDPAFRVYVIAEPELFLDGTWYLDKKYNLSGFKRYYIETDMAEILRRIKPAGVYAEMTILSSRLNIPWDRIILTWHTTIKTYWHRLLDGTWNLNNGIVSFINRYLDGSWTLNNEYNLDGMKMIRSTKPGDILIGEPLYYHTRTYKRKFSLQTTRQLYLDGRIGLNGKFVLSGQIVGASVGYSMCRITKRITQELVGQAYLDGTWVLNGEMKVGGKFIYYRNGTETYLVKEVV